MARKLPGDTKQRNAVILAIQRAIENSFSATDWKDLGYRTGTQEWIKNHPRLLRSLSWGDSDYGGHVLDAIEKILETDPSNLDELLSTPSINEWLLKNDAAALGYVSGAPGPTPVVTLAPLKTTSKAVETALADAEVLIKSTGPSSAVDRVHTALHGYLLAVCDSAGIAYNPNPGITELLKAIRQQHPIFAKGGPHQAKVAQIAQSLATTIHNINELRNQASGAHPNKDTLGPEEAVLAIDGTRSVFNYLNSKL